MKHPRIPRRSLFLCIFSLAYLSILRSSNAFSSARQMINKNRFAGMTPDIRLQAPSKINGNLLVKDAKNTVEGQQDYSTPRLLQIFSARLILEVFGSAGAVWGFLDVCKLRNHATNELWRQYAVTVGVIFFIRYCLQISDYVKLTKTENGVASKTDYWVRFFQIFSAKLVLEVFGGAGAVWYVTSYHCNTVRFKIFFWLFRIYLCNNQFFCPYKGDSRKF